MHDVESPNVMPLPKNLKPKDTRPKKARKEFDEIDHDCDNAISDLESKRGARIGLMETPSTDTPTSHGDTVGVMSKEEFIEYQNRQGILLFMNATQSRMPPLSQHLPVPPAISVVHL